MSKGCPRLSITRRVCAKKVQAVCCTPTVRSLTNFLPSNCHSNGLHRYGEFPDCAPEKGAGCCHRHHVNIGRTQVVAIVHTPTRSASRWLPSSTRQHRAHAGGCHCPHTNIECTQACMHTDAGRAAVLENGKNTGVHPSTARPSSRSTFQHSNILTFQHSNMQLERCAWKQSSNRRTDVSTLHPFVVKPRVLKVGAHQEHGVVHRELRRHLDEERHAVRQVVACAAVR